MNVVDSSGWLEYFAAGPNADFFKEPIRDAGRLVVPTLSIYEVFRWTLRRRGEEAALRAAAQMKRGRVVGLSADLALHAAGLGLERGLPLADSIILATAVDHRATLWTQDADFEGIDGVRYRPAPSDAPDRRKG